MANLSSLITQTVGTASTGVNLITAPSSASIWTPTTITATTTTTSTELPLSPAVGSATKFTLAASTGSAYADFDVPTSLLNTKLGMSWFARASTSPALTAAITLSLVSYASSANRTANTSPTTVTLQTSSVLGIATQFLTTFDASSQQFYRLTISFAAQSTAWYSIAQFQVGPGAVGQGAAISSSQSFTPGASTQGLGTLASVGLFETRVGDQLHIQGRFTAGTTTAVEARLGFLAGRTTGNYTNTTVVGKWWVNQTANPSIKVGTINCTSGQTYITFGLDDKTSTTSPFAALNGNSAFNAADVVSVDFWVYVAEWAGNGTVNLGAGAQVEYLSSDFASFSAVRSPAGTLLPTTTPAGTLEIVNAGTQPWQYATQISDSMKIEFQVAGTGPWLPVNGAEVSKFYFDGTNFIGLGFYHDGSVWRIARGKYRQGTSTAWSTVTAGSRYRIVKANPSAPVGFGLASTDGSSGLYKAGSAPGQITGAAVASGYVGERIASSTFGDYVLTTSLADVPSATITLTPGVWRIFYSVSIDVVSGATSGNNTEGYVQITDGANALIGISRRGLLVKTVAAVSNEVLASLSTEEIVSISTSTTYKLRAFRIDNAGTGAGSIQGSNNASHSSTFYAVRIA